MQVGASQIIGTAVATGLVGFLVWLATVPLRQRSVTGLVASVVVTGPLAVLGGIGWALTLGPEVRSPEAALVLALVAVLVAAAESGVAATRAYRRFLRAQRALRSCLGSFAGGSTDLAGRPLLSELEAVRADLSDLARDLHAERSREHALDESRRRLIAWVSQDLHAPLTVLRAMTDPVSGGPEAPAVRDELDRLVSVVDDLFDLATASPDHAARSLVVPRWEPTRLADVLGDAVAALEPLVRLRGVGVRVSGDTTAQVRLLGPGGEDLGRTLVTELVDAVRRSRTGSTVHVQVTPLPDDDTVRVDLLAGDADVVTSGLRLPLATASV